MTVIVLALIHPNSTFSVGSIARAKLWTTYAQCPSGETAKPCSLVLFGGSRPSDCQSGGRAERPLR
jgi:hypothetical protein